MHKFVSRYPVFILSAWLCAAAWVQAQGMPPAPVYVAAAESIRMAPVAWMPGTVVSRSDARVAAEVQGRLLRVAEVGSRFAQGEAVAQIEEKISQQKLTEEVAAVGSIRARLHFLNKEVKRLQVLAKRDAASKNLLEETEAERDVASSELVAARARADRAADDLARCVVKAPFDGVVTERLARAGESVALGDHIFRFVDPDAREVQVRIPVGSVAFVDVGNELAVSAGGQTAVGVVRQVVPVGDDRSRLYELRLEIGDASWLAGQTVRVAVPTEASRTVIAVPRDALVIRRDNISVFRIGEGNIADKVTVTTGIANGSLIEVSGIDAGDQVVTRGGERLRPGQAVAIQP